jgi:prepilin peptidase CpaA
MKGPESLLQFAPLLAALTWAAVGDVRSSRIPNILTFPLAVAGIAASFMTGHVLTPWQAVFGLLVGFALPLPSFVLGAMGGGDVKLLAAVGAWVGPTGALIVYAASAIVGMLIVLAQAAMQGRLSALFRNSAVVAVNLVHLRELGANNAKTVGQSCRSIDKPLPYAVPVLIGVLVLLTWPWLSGAAA